MASLGYNVPLHRTLAFGFAAFLAALGGVLYVWWSGQIAPGDVDLPQTINLLIMAVIGGLVRIEGAWVGAFVFILMQNYITRHARPAARLRRHAVRRQLQHGHRDHLPRHRPRLPRRADRHLGPALCAARRGLVERGDAAAPAAAEAVRNERTPRVRLESWVATARESRTPSEHTRGRRASQDEETQLRSWKTALLLVVVAGRGRGCGDGVVCGVARQGRQGRDHDRLQGRLRLRLRARHRRGTGCVRAVRRTARPKNQNEAVRRA